MTRLIGCIKEALMREKGPSLSLPLPPSLPVVVVVNDLKLLFTINMDKSWPAFLPCSNGQGPEWLSQQITQRCLFLELRTDSLVEVCHSVFFCCVTPSPQQLSSYHASINLALSPSLPLSLLISSLSLFFPHSPTGPLARL